MKVTVTYDFEIKDIVELLKAIPSFIKSIITVDKELSQPDVRQDVEPCGVPGCPCRSDN
jgi:hypothetical protein